MPRGRRCLAQCGSILVLLTGVPREGYSGRRRGPCTSWSRVVSSSRLSTPDGAEVPKHNITTSKQCICHLCTSGAHHLAKASYADVLRVVFNYSLVVKTSCADVLRHACNKVTGRRNTNDPPRGRTHRCPKRQRTTTWRALKHRDGTSHYNAAEDGNLFALCQMCTDAACP